MPSKKKRLTMGAVIILPTANHEWGMWGASLHNGYDPNVTWTAASRFLAETFRLKPEQVRDLLAKKAGASEEAPRPAVETAGGVNEASVPITRFVRQGWRYS